MTSGKPGQCDGAEGDGDVMLDPWKLLRPPEVAEQSRGGHDDEAERERPDLALVQQLRLEAQRDRRQHHAGEDQEAAVLLRTHRGRGWNGLLG